jgi:predicted glycosyltransferase
MLLKDKMFGFPSGDRKMNGKKILFVSGSLGLGHIGRDLEIAKALRKKTTGIDIFWLAEKPASIVIAV